jgi:carboxyl-terminal processing protease
MLKARSIPILVFAGIAALVLAAAMAATDDTLYKQGETYARVYAFLRANYVDEDKVKSDTLFYGALKGMAESTGDPYTTYLDPQEFDSAKSHTEGEFVGIGVVFRTLEDGRHLVIAPLRNSPAYQAGIRAGDVIEAVDGKPVKGLDATAVQTLIKGAAGTEVSVTVLRHDTQKSDTIKLNRAVLKVESVVAAGFVNEEKKIGYVRVEQFSKDTAEDLAKALKDLRDKGMKGLIIDLRDNGGGLLTQAVKVADLFIDEGVIVSTKGRAPDTNRVYNAQGGNTLFPGNHLPIVILVNKGTASASEIVSGALRDHDDPVARHVFLVGGNTYGKDSVQTIEPMEDGKSALKLTIAHYYTPNNTPLFGGLKPDIAIEIPDEKWAEISRNRIDYELHNDGKPYTGEDDTQLTAAIEKISAALEKIASENP